MIDDNRAMQTPLRDIANRTRRQLLITTALIATGCAGRAPLRMDESHRVRSDATRPLVKPPRLRDGDRVALIAPGGAVSDALIEKAIANVTSIGLTPLLGKNVRARRGGYAGTVGERVNDLHTAFFDDSIRALWPIRGGSGCAALLPHLDYARIRANAKALIGYSDITALHLALLAQAQLVSFHGPVASSTFSDFSIRHLRRVLFDGADTFEIEPSLYARSTDARDAALRYRALNGVAPVVEGRLIGGNLSILASLLGTPYAPSFDDAVVFLEDVAEAPYRIDRLLTQLAQAGVFARASGVAHGIFQRITPTDGEPSLSLFDVLSDQFGALPIPAGYGFPIGHIGEQATLPLGINARLDAANGTLTLLEVAVS